MAIDEAGLPSEASSTTKHELPVRSRSASTALPGDDFAEQHPALAVEAGELHLLDGIEVVCGCVVLDSRQQHRQTKVLQVGRLPHHVIACEVVAALPEHLDQRLGDAVAIDVKAISQVSLRVILLHPLYPILKRLVLLPLW